MKIVRRHHAMEIIATDPFRAADYLIVSNESTSQVDRLVTTLTNHFAHPAASKVVDNFPSYQN